MTTGRENVSIRIDVDTAAAQAALDKVVDQVRSYTRDGDPVPDFRLRCPFCGGELDTFDADYGSSPSENLLSGRPERDRPAGTCRVPAAR